MAVEGKQKIIADVRKGSRLVAAAAGSGKTFVAIERTAALIDEGVDPTQILVLMYNTEAAVQFRARLAVKVGAATAEAVCVRTFHAFALGLLKEWFGSEFRELKLLQDGSAYFLAKEVLQKLSFKGSPKIYLAAADVARERMELFEAGQMPVGETNPRLPAKAIAFMRAYQAAKAAKGYYDFADMLYATTQVLQKGGPAVEAVVHRYTHVMADEAQDLSRARWAVLEPFGRHAESFVLIGDRRQNLYNFGGADDKILHEFCLTSDEAEEADCAILTGVNTFYGAGVLSLPVNRRSTHEIVKLSNKVSRPYAWHVGGDAEPLESNAQGRPTEMWITPDQKTEADKVVAYVEAIRARRASSELLAIVDKHCAVERQMRAPIAVLVRTNAWGVLIEQSLMIAEIPVIVRGGKGAWESNEGKDFLAYLGALEGDPAADVLRVANKPMRFLSKTLIEDLKLSASDAETKGPDRLGQLFVALRECNNRGAGKFADDLETLAKLSWSKRCIAIGNLLRSDAKRRKDENAEDEEIIHDMHMDPTQFDRDEERNDVFAALGKAATMFGSYLGIKARMMKKARKLGSSEKPEMPWVEISTSFKYKGDEAPIVIVAGACVGTMPHKKSANREEELRVFYVSITRARDHLIISTGGPAPSPFLLECGLLTAAEVDDGSDDGDGSGEDMEQFGADRVERAARKRKTPARRPANDHPKNGA